MVISQELMRFPFILLATLLILALCAGLYAWNAPAPNFAKTNVSLSMPEAMSNSSPTPIRDSLDPPTSALSKNKTSTRPLALPAVVPSQDGRTVEFHVENGLAVAYGDIVLGKVESGSTISKGNYEPQAPLLWDKPEIPYLISPELPDPSRVERAVQYFNQHTPVTFIPRSDQPDAVVFEPGPEHCFSTLGRSGGLQPINLAKDCHTQEILHEMMHALGFVHEQSRTDRDTYLRILWDNIEEKYRPQFAIVPDSLMEAMRGTPFDYHSIMLYRADTFTTHPGLASIQPTGPGPIDPVHEGLSEMDIQRLKRLFRL
jgi:hypothetical protein